jgi:hypothetical protein
VATYRLRDAHRSLQPDLFRRDNPFKPEIEQSNRDLANAIDDESRTSVLAKWLVQHQPCIFGKLAAARDLISYCFITEEDLANSDEAICTKLQIARKGWKSQAEHGKRSAFIILATSHRLVEAMPDDNLKRFALELAGLYLKRQIVPDQIFTDQIKLWNLRFTEQRRWGVGANVFTVQGDQRWWHDHRIPGGLGFSMNSVGHLVAAEARRHAIQEAQKTVVKNAPLPRVQELRTLEAQLAALSQTSVQSLEHALKYAMHTIYGASSGESGVVRWEAATRLLRGGPDVKCPFPLVANDGVLKEMDWATYLGWYHTDVTLPSEYFLPQQERPSRITCPFALDFSYLHDRRGPDYKKLAEGILVRTIQLKRAGRKG